LVFFQIKLCIRERLCIEDINKGLYTVQIYRIFFSSFVSLDFLELAV
jgi:hypothetical protein